jgi:nicotinate-nucleotide pyrophosphorylase
LIDPSEFFALATGPPLFAQLEVRTLDEVRTALTLAGDLDRIMLDNMVKVDATTGAVDTSMLRAALALINGAHWRVR